MNSENFCVSFCNCTAFTYVQCTIQILYSTDMCVPLTWTGDSFGKCGCWANGKRTVWWYGMDCRLVCSERFGWFPEAMQIMKVRVKIVMCVYMYSTLQIWNLPLLFFHVHCFQLSQLPAYTCTAQNIFWFCFWKPPSIQKRRRGGFVRSRLLSKVSPRLSIDLFIKRHAGCLLFEASCSSRRGVLQSKQMCSAFWR